MPASSRLKLILLGLTLFAAPLRASDITAVDRTIGKQPAYGSAPRYCLLLVGSEAKTRVWIVEDGSTLYVDRNANGDLTDDGPPLQPTDVRDLGALPGGTPHWDYAYVLDEIKPVTGPTLTKFRLRRWNYGETQDSYGLSLTLHDDKPGKTRSDPPAGRPSTGSQAADARTTDGGIPMYAGWFGTFWAGSPAEASVIPFGGRLEPKLLREKEFVVGSGVRRLSVALITPGVGDAGPALLSEFAVPASTPIYARIEWPVGVGSPPLVTTHKLGEHCCYWEYYDSEFRVPEGKGIVEGTATVTIDVPGGKFPLPLRTNKIEVRVRMTVPPSSPGK